MIKPRALLIFILLIKTVQTEAQRKGYWQQAVNYKMDINVDEVNFQYQGNMTLTYSNNSGQTLSKVYFHLYYNAFQPGSMMDHRLSNIEDPDSRMTKNISRNKTPIYQSRIAKLLPNQIGYQKIHSIKQGNIEATYQIKGTLLEVTLPYPIQPNTTTELEMHWEAQVPEQIRRTGRNSKEGVALSMAQWYPKMAHFDEFGWHLDEYIAREFVAPFGNFDVQIHINKDYVLGSSGVLQNPNQVKGYSKSPQITPINNKVTWHFIAQNINDFAWAADPNFVVDSTTTPSGINLYAVYLPKSQTAINNWRQALAYTSEFLEFCSEKFGKYPWSTYTIAQGGDGGMEYGTFTLVTGDRDLKSLVGVIFHEAAHSWYQQLFGINETVDEWFDEGFTCYLEELGMQHIFHKKGVHHSNPMIDYYRSYYRLALSGKEEPMSLLADYYNSNYAYSNQAYRKGAVMAEQLGYIIGQQNLSESFLRFYDLWKLKHPTPNDFKRVAEEVSGINLKWYFNLFINTTRTIDYAISNVKDSTITIVNKSNLPMPLDILVEYTDGSKELFYIPLREMRGQKPDEEYEIYKGVNRTQLEDWFWTKPKYQFKTTKKPKKVWIDATERLADIDFTNNYYEVK